MSDSDSDDGAAMEALQKKIADELEFEQVKRPNVFLLPLSAQLAQKSKVEVEDNVDQEYEKLERKPMVDDPQMLNEKITNEFIIPFPITEIEKTNIFLDNPGRNTIVPEFSGFLFSTETKSCIEKLLEEQHYSENFKTFMHNQLTQNIEEINIRSIISNCVKLSSEEWHCIAKYLLFVMSICQNEKTVDLISSTLLDFADSYTLCLEDFLQIFINWGVPEVLLHPPYVLDNNAILNNDCSQDSNVDIKDYNIYKVLDLMKQLFYNRNVQFDVKSRMTFVRALIMIWLDKRFTVSWNSYRFKVYITYFVDKIDVVGGHAENIEVICSILDFSHEHTHNQGWIIKKFLEGDTPSMKLIGYYIASQFLLRVLCHETTPYRQLSLCGLHTVLSSAVLEHHDLYSVHVILLVIDAYLTSYNTTKDDREIIESIIQWTNSALLSYQDDAKCEMLDKQIIVGQMRHINIKLQLLLEEDFPDEFGAVRNANATADEDPFTM